MIDTPQRQPGESDITQLLDVLEDEDCRAIFGATSAGGRSAKELADECGIALSTVYRKVEKLVRAGFLDERVRFSGPGRHASEYVPRLERVEFTFSARGELDVTVTRIDDEETQISDRTDR